MNATQTTEGIKMEKFFDSWGGLWETCDASAPGAEAFGPTGIARRVEGPSAAEAAAQDRYMPAEGLDDWPLLAD